MTPTIDPEFHELIPALSNDERDQLEANLKAEGCRDPIVVWNGVIVDGHNRFEICTRNGIAFEKISKRFADRAEAVEWIIRNQFGRRNLSAAARTLLALKLEESIKARAKAKQEKSGGPVPQKSAEPPIETREELAKLAGVSRDTVDKVRKVEKHGTPEIKQAMRAGEISINKAHQTVKAPKPEPEPEPVVVDESKGQKHTRLPSWTPDDAERLWLLAKTHLDKILKEDRSRARVLQEVIDYAQNRIETNK